MAGIVGNCPNSTRTANSICAHADVVDGLRTYRGGASEFTALATVFRDVDLIAMPTRQAGHFFFEPRGYDHINHATHEHKEEIKVGYNLNRKVVLLSLWGLSPLALYFDPTLFGIFTPAAGKLDFIRQVAEMWLVIGIGGVVFRTIHLFVIKDVQTGLVWATKILTDPFHDIKLYHKAPLALMRGELIDPNHGRHSWDEEEEDEAEEAPHATT